MKISPEPRWNNIGSHRVTLPSLPLKKMLREAIRSLKGGTSEVISVHDKNGTKLGSFTPEWFLSLDRRHQLRFLSVAKRMHDTGVDR